MHDLDDARSRFAVGDTKGGLKALDVAYYAIQRGSRDAARAEQAQQLARSIAGSLEGRDAKKAERYVELFGVLSHDYARYQAVDQQVESDDQPLLPISTLDELHGHRIAAQLGVVTGFAVMSRNVFSDAGSDLQSAFGGRLGGIEQAIRTGHEAAERSLSQQARRLGADAVVGVRVSVETVADKAQMVLLAGTAVTLAERPPNAM